MTNKITAANLTGQTAPIDLTGDGKIDEWEKSLFYQKAGADHTLQKNEASGLVAALQTKESGLNAVQNLVNLDGNGKVDTWEKNIWNSFAGDGTMSADESKRMMYSLDGNNDGKISDKEKNLAKGAGAFVGDAKSADIDGNGTINPWENKLWHHFAGDDKHMDFDEARMMRDVLDANGDKTLSSKEKLYAKRMVKGDLDGNGTVDQWETNLRKKFEGKGYNSKTVDICMLKIMAGADAPPNGDGDGKVTKAEVETYREKRPDF